MLVLNGNIVSEITILQAFGPDNECIEPQEAELIQVDINTLSPDEGEIWLTFQGDTMFSMTLNEFQKFVEQDIIDYPEMS